MILKTICGTEAAKPYQDLAASNLQRQYDFLKSTIEAAVAVEHNVISADIIKALNYQAIACLHDEAGEYRSGPVTVGSYQPPESSAVPKLMEEFIGSVNEDWQSNDILSLPTYCLWRLNHIHPFINGNGRTARALCYFVLCVRAGGWLTGAPILPELIRQNRDEYVKLLRSTDEAYEKESPQYLAHLAHFIGSLLLQQINNPGEQHSLL